MPRYLLQQFLSFITATIVTVNLAFWWIPLTLLAILRLIFQSDAARKVVNGLSEWSYRRAVSVHNLWMFKIVGIKLSIEGELPDHPAPIIISNHQTWMDIPVLHGAITKTGPTLKFLIKRELLWVPIIGWICYSLNFPRLNRGKGQDARQKDLAAIQSFSSSLNSERGALMIFAEGTRFTPQKHENQKSPYKNLLVPRPGGIKIALGSVTPETPVIDATVIYDGETNFWRCLGGSTRNIRVVLRSYPASEITDIRDWIDERWQEKDRFF